MFLSSACVVSVCLCLRVPVCAFVCLSVYVCVLVYVLVLVRLWLCLCGVCWSRLRL